MIIKAKVPTHQPEKYWLDAIFVSEFKLPKRRRYLTEEEVRSFTRGKLPLYSIARSPDIHAVILNDTFYAHPDGVIRHVAKYARRLIFKNRKIETASEIRDWK